MNIQNVLQSLKKNVVYVAFLGITFIASIVLTVWSLSATGGGTLEIIRNAKVVTTETTITEYLAGETVNTDGVTLVLEDGRVITDTAYTVEADLTTAGTKAVSVVYEENGEKYVGKYAVEVFLIRHFDLRSYPKVLVKSSRGYTFDGFTLWAELSGIPTTGRFSTTPDHPEWKNTVIIANDMYDITVEENDNTSVCTAKVKVGVRDLSFEFYGAAAGIDTSKTNGAVAVLSFTNADNQSQDRLTLFVHQQETNGGDSPNGATGWYVYESRNGSSVTYSYYQFSYHIDGWTSNFTSESFGQGLKDEMAGDATSVNVTVNGQSFISASNWRPAIVPIAAG